ncbi:NgoMIV family type II restriction endonuclease [Agromyces kandeliae]|uniref:Restriction endonuclease n=1 Tax=Agromyces kandeliae TaxID=2666141 RepID=A0A6L5R4J6_9MICO|nr:NgoMIV family type II restriction endonuclease [Agromyces kandeliae]MRX44504.1 restriction endonuclease [Agromyces kandeliae]
MSAIVTDERHAFHQQLIASSTLVITEVQPKDKKKQPFDCASNSDSGQKFSVDVGLDIAKQLGASRAKKRLDGQVAGKRFEAAVQSFLSATFLHLGALRPGTWEIENVGGSRGVYHLARYEPYRHLDDLAQAIEMSPTLASVLGNSYDISPDVIVIRKPESDSHINNQTSVVDGSTARLSPIRQANQTHGIVHAVVSCKWTLRSDRAQNARSEALNIIRNRKGRTPHIAVVTGEPSSTRLASLALGTGDVDTVYHFALPELTAATKRSGNSEAQQMLQTLVDGRRLRDISDLPLDLAI